MWLTIGVVTVLIAVVVCLLVVGSAFDEETSKRPQAIRIRLR